MARHLDPYALRAMSGSVLYWVLRLCRFES
jgi:hypothetical protein